MVRQVIAPLLLLTCWAGASPAQTVLERAAYNAQVAMTICLNNYLSPQMIHPAFTAAGFRHEREQYGDEAPLEYFVAPDQTATATVSVGEFGSVSCAVSSDHFAVSQALPFARAVAEQALRKQLSVGSPEKDNIVPGHPQARGTPCSGFSVLVPRAMIWIEVGTAGQDPVCVDNGTAQIMMHM